MRVKESSKAVRNWSLRRKTSVVFAALIVGGVTFLSFLPSSNKRMLHTRGKYHSWGHLITFAVVSFVFAGIARSRRARFLFFLGAIVLGFGIEYGEHMLYHSPLEWKDVLVDSMGVIGGTIMALFIPPSDQEPATQE